MSTEHQLQPGCSIALPDISTTGHDFHSNRKEAEWEFKQLRKEIISYQEKLYAEGRQKLLILFQAMDAGGKDGTIRKVFQGVNAQGMRVTSFKKPSTLERAHDYLWRVHKAVPQAGKIEIFNRSHYEDVLVVRVDNLVPEETWQERYEQINQFENLLAATGTTILKFYLHISKEEQKERFQSRLDDPAKHWKFSMDDLAKRKLWNAYQLAYEDMLNNCTTEQAPWYIIPADQKWYRNLAIARVIVQALDKMNPQFPEAEEQWENVTID